MKSYTVTIHTKGAPPQTERVEAATAVDAIQRALGAISPHAEVVGVEVGCGELRRLRDAIHGATLDLCSCGGSGPNDPGCCVACKVWHRVREDERTDCNLCGDRGRIDDIPCPQCGEGSK